MENNSKNEIIDDLYLDQTTTTTQSFTPIDFLEQAANIVPTAYIYFDQTLTKYGRQNPVCFVEGNEDKEYYIPRIKKFATNKEAHEIICGNKDNVINIKLYIDKKQSYNDCKLLYFVDKDYDSSKNLKASQLDIFVTDYYSVENYYSSDDFICNFALEYANESDPNIHSQLVQLFGDWKRDLFKTTKQFCAWLKVARNRQMAKDAKDKHKKSFPSEYGVINHKGITKYAYSFDRLNNDYKLNPPVTASEYNDAMMSLTSINEIRGKFVIQFVEAFIEHIRINAGRKGSVLKKQFSFEYNRKTLSKRLSSCADTTQSLKKYIQSRLA